MLILPFLPSNPEYTFSTVIDQVEYLFRVRWNSRAAAWYFDVSEQDGTLIAAGIKIVLGAYLGRLTIHPLFRSGLMVAIDRSNKMIDAGFDDLGTRIEVRWFPLDEAVAQFGANGEDFA